MLTRQSEKFTSNDTVSKENKENENYNRLNSCQSKAGNKSGHVTLENHITKKFRKKRNKFCVSCNFFLKRRKNEEVDGILQNLDVQENECNISKQ